MKLSKMEFFRAGIMLGLEDVKGPTNSFPDLHVCLSPCQGKTVHRSTAGTYGRDTWKLGTTVNVLSITQISHHSSHK